MLAEEGSEEAGWGVVAVRGGAQLIAAACVAGAGSQVCARGCDDAAPAVLHQPSEALHPAVVMQYHHAAAS